MSKRVMRARLAGLVLGLSLHGFAAAPARGAEPNAFKLALFKDRLAHEVAFRAAAIHVAWGAEPLCDSTTEIEPFLLWSVHALGTSLSTKELALLRQATGMDEQWRVADRLCWHRGLQRLRCGPEPVLAPGQPASAHSGERHAGGELA